MIVCGDQVKVWKAIYEVMPSDVPRVALVDTCSDEKMKAILVAETSRVAVNVCKIFCNAKTIDPPLGFQHSRIFEAKYASFMRWLMSSCYMNFEMCELGKA
jgi:hypothetical protein